MWKRTNAEQFSKVRCPGSKHQPGFVENGLRRGLRAEIGGMSGMTFRDGFSEDLSQEDQLPDLGMISNGLQDPLTVRRYWAFTLTKRAGAPSGAPVSVTATVCTSPVVPTTVWLAVAPASGVHPTRFVEVSTV